MHLDFYADNVQQSVTIIKIRRRVGVAGCPWRGGAVLAPAVVLLDAGMLLPNLGARLLDQLGFLRRVAELRFPPRGEQSRGRGERPVRLELRRISKKTALLFTFELQHSLQGAHLIISKSSINNSA